jgi:hypothetical protein
MSKFSKRLKLWINGPEAEFHNPAYLRITARRLEHLVSLGLPLRNRTVLEVGAGVGDHTHFYLDRGCRMTVTEVREDNLQCIRRRYRNASGVRDIRALDVENPVGEWAVHDIVHCYGLLYHLKEPMKALDFMSNTCSELLVLETVLSYGSEAVLNSTEERVACPSQSFHGVGCRPTWAWVFSELKKRFPYVYATRTQPNHPEFPIDWTDESKKTDVLSRGIFVASRVKLDNALLSEEIPRQQRYEGE